MRSLQLPGPILVDGVFFQHYQNSGIARVWRNILQEWVTSGFAENIVVVDRAATFPSIVGIRTIPAPMWRENATGADSLLLQALCDRERASVFVSTYHTTPISTPSVFVAHDFLPERFVSDLSHPQWREKRLALAHASRIICVSNTTKSDLRSLYPEFADTPAEVAHNAVAASFRPPTNDEVQAFKAKHGLETPYVLMVGQRLGAGGYKNGASVFRALQTWRRRHDIVLLCVGGEPGVEKELRDAGPDVAVKLVSLNDQHLAAAYAGALALVYPSLAEGFGLPILEAMATGCPVIAADVDVAREVAGNAAILIDPNAEEDLHAALEAVADPIRRHALSQVGASNLTRFSWAQTAERYAAACTATAQAAVTPAAATTATIWRLLREEQRTLQSHEVNGARLQASGTPPKSPFLPLLMSIRAHLLPRAPQWARPILRRVWRCVTGFRP